MINLEQLQLEIETLPEKDSLRLRRWFADKDWARWDSQLEADVTAGKLDFLLEEALAAEAQDLTLPPFDGVRVADCLFTTPELTEVPAFANQFAE
jgi:hypothetical protein